MNPFKHFMDQELMKSQFQTHLQAFSKKPLLITECKFERSRNRYETIASEKRIKCLAVRYQLSVMELQQRRKEIQMLYTKVYPDEYAEKIFEKISKESVSQMVPAQVPDYLPDLKMIAWTFPNDPKLHQLSALIDLNTAKEHLPYTHLPPGLDGPEDINSLKVDIIRYHPEVRCTMCYHLTWGESGNPKTISIYGKTFLSDEGERLFQLTRGMWELSSKDPQFFIIAKPLVYDAQQKMVWQQAITGKPLMSLIDETHHEDHMKAVAINLASLHKSVAGQDTPHTTRDGLPVIQSKIKELVDAFPNLASSLRGLSGRLENDFLRLTPMKERPAHGAFRIKEILECEGELAVFDLDNVAIGDSARDLALFLVDLYAEYHDQEILYSMASSFYQNYRAQVDWVLPFERLQWHVRVQFLKRTYWLYKHKQQDPGLEKRLEKVISAACQRDPFKLNVSQLT